MWLKNNLHGEKVQLQVNEVSLKRHSRNDMKNMQRWFLFHHLKEWKSSWSTWTEHWTVLMKKKWEYCREAVRRDQNYTCKMGGMSWGWKCNIVCTFDATQVLRTRRLKKARWWGLDQEFTFKSINKVNSPIFTVYVILLLVLLIRCKIKITHN